jgi:hypothetical protein
MRGRTLSQYHVPPVTESMVKHWFILLLLGARDAYDVYDWHVFREGYDKSGDGDQLNSTKKSHTTSYSIDGTEFTDTKAEKECHSKRLPIGRDSVYPYVVRTAPTLPCLTAPPLPCLTRA